MDTFRVLGLPQEVPVRDDVSGIVEQGYRITVQDNETGARATIDIPRSKYSVDNVRALAEYELGRHRSVLAAFAPPAEPG